MDVVKNEHLTILLSAEHREAVWVTGEEALQMKLTKATQTAMLEYTRQETVYGLQGIDLIHGEDSCCA
ncbi:hypothetical protein COV06_01210 [Candidatus Uhrbacteria bacterium CG10_big_fil_rev_8_21_14_0_10_50_16]|uniref:Uncharacterized protein n=1 Tax=Candidatus Uhrbacteria bacterium CG10_big_fil_rev_8_21_14_0_10_50_16 TaxID=1975039 RepID=A0A2H0RN74_9BACT|nr:MAG: hypothetical protein COV06_01210 [Candidatus Uhrbacteria bacterium CG10_big_fil_rev_8_21_14_0_10_50_16]